MQVFKGIEYLKIDVANSFGLDKEDWAERLRWYHANQHRLMGLLGDAENPAQYCAGVRAIQEVEAGRRNTGYLVSLDATSSGIQILSVLTGDRRAAEVSNVVDTGRRRDAYTDLYESMVARVGPQAQFERSDLKQAIMTAFYGSEAIPKEVFGRGPLLQAFFRTLEEETPHVWALNRAFLKMWDPKALVYQWVMPDNFHVRIKVVDTVQETVSFMGHTFATERRENRPVLHGRSIGANITHSVDGFIVRELARRCDYDPARRDQVQQLIVDGPSKVPYLSQEMREHSRMVATLWDLYEKSGYLSARILDHLASWNIQVVDTDPLQDLLDSLPQRPFKILPIHDCFKVHPNYGNDLRKQYNLQLSLLAQSKMLEFLLGQLLGRSVEVRKQADFSEEILRADYALS